MIYTHEYNSSLLDSSEAQLTQIKVRYARFYYTTGNITTARVMQLGLRRYTLSMKSI